jgi:hypothetical protein
VPSRWQGGLGALIVTLVAMLLVAAPVLIDARTDQITPLRAGTARSRHTPPKGGTRSCAVG